MAYLVPGASHVGVHCAHPLSRIIIRSSLSRRWIQEKFLCVEIEKYRVLMILWSLPFRYTYAFHSDDLSS